MEKYVWLVLTLSKAGEEGLSLKELSKLWQETDNSGGNPIPRQTFERWKWGVGDAMGVNIDFHTDGYRYYISNPEVLEERKLNRWLLDTYATYITLAQGIAVNERILVEEIPSSHEYLTEILNAMRENRVIEIAYKNFVGGEKHNYTLAPYCVKMSQKRWYVLALSVDENILRIFGLDRIEEMKITKERFKVPKDFDAREYFKPYFGVVCDETVKEERIVLRAKGSHQNYLRSLPLHESQRELSPVDGKPIVQSDPQSKNSNSDSPQNNTAATEEYADFEYHLRPTYDFCWEVLKYGDMLEVLEPQSLRDEMRAKAEELVLLYKKKR